MKKFVFLSILLTSASIHAQDFEQDVSTVKSRFDYTTNKIQLSDISYSKSIDLNPTPYKLGTQIFAFNHENSLYKTSRTNLNFSKNSKLQYGLGLTFTYRNEPLATVKPSIYSDSKASFSSSAFLNYTINPNYSLSSEIKYTNGLDAGTQISIGAKKIHVFNRKHRLVTMFSVSWSNRGVIDSDYWKENDRRPAQLLNLNKLDYNHTELKLGTRWNWDINTNWSLSTGIMAKQQLSNSAKSPFAVQKTPVTIFSIATYRF